MSSTNSTSPLHTTDSNNSGAFRELSVELLDFPAGLFDPGHVPPGIDEPLHVPLTVCRQGERYIVIDGCKRLAHSRQRGNATCACMVHAGTLDDERIALLRIALNRNRTFSLPEKLCFIRRLRELYPDERTYREVCGTLPFDKRERFELEQLCVCDRTTIDAVLAGSLEKSLAPDADRFDPPDRDAVLSLFSQLRFSAQMQRELLDWLPELAFREKCTVAHLITVELLPAIDSNDHLNAPQKIDLLRRTVFNRRFPTIAQAKRVWEEHAAALNPAPSQVHFRPAEAFEKNRLELKISVTSADEAVRIFTAFAAVSPVDWDRLIYPAQLYGKTG